MIAAAARVSLVSACCYGIASANGRGGRGAGSSRQRQRQRGRERALALGLAQMQASLVRSSPWSPVSTCARAPGKDGSRARQRMVRSCSGAEHWQTPHALALFFSPVHTLLQHRCGDQRCSRCHAVKRNIGVSGGWKWASRLAHSSVTDDCSKRTEVWVVHARAITTLASCLTYLSRQSRCAGRSGGLLADVTEDHNFTRRRRVRLATHELLSWTVEQFCDSCLRADLHTFNQACKRET